MSHTSRIGSAIIFDSIALMININGMANKKVIPKAINFLYFPTRLKTATIIHKKIIEATAKTAPTENTSFALIKLLNSNKKGITKTLNDSKLTMIPLFPSMILGKDITHAKTMELTGISDHVNLPDIAILQIRHTIIPIKSVTENRIEIITFFVMS